MKISNWAFALFGTSVLAATGCQHPPKANAPCATCAQQQRWPIAKDSGQAAVVSHGVNSSNEQVILVPDPGTAPLPNAAFARREPDPLPTMAVPAIVSLPTATAPLPPLPSLPPPTPPLNFDSGKTSPPKTQPAASSGSPASDWTAPDTPAPILPPPNVSTLPMSARPPAIAPIAAPAAPTSALQEQGFSHSDDYQVLTGQVQSFRQDWKLRYADYATVDPYGGSVILEGGQLDKLQNGCQVRVRGRLIPPSDRTSPARFQVQSVDVIGQ